MIGGKHDFQEDMQPTTQNLANYDLSEDFYAKIWALELQ